MLKTGATVEKDSLIDKSVVPIIDVSFGTEECPVKSVVNRVATQLAKALKEKSMAMLVNHGITDEKLKIAYNYFDEFCKLPDATKELYLRKIESGNHGYVKPGQEKFDGVSKDIRHAFNICTLQSQPLPDEPLPGFKECIAELAKEFKKVSNLILQALAISLELPINFFVEKHSHMLDYGQNETTFRLLYYPPLIIDDDKNENFCKGSYRHQKTNFDESKLGSLEIKDDDDDVNGNAAAQHVNKGDVNKNITRCGAHCDYGTFTLLVQDSEGGLEVKMPNSEKWQKLGNLPGAIFINGGELLATWTNNLYPALNHRVVIPDNQIACSKGRHSIAFFVHPDNLTPIIPIDEPSHSEETVDSSKSKTRKKSFKAAKMKIYNAYQHVQKRFKETYT